MPLTKANMPAGMRSIKIMASVVAALSATAASVEAKSIDVVAIVDLNFRYADCQPQERTYDLKRYSTIYYGASIVCQLNVAYITYDRKYRYQGG